MMRTLLDAVAFLTRIPIRTKIAAPGRTAVFLPLLSAVLGTAGAAIYIALSRAMPNSVAALVTVVSWTAIARVHRENRPARYEGIAIVLTIVARWLAIVNLADSHLWEIFIAAQTVPRAAMVALAWVSRPSGTGLGLAFSSTLSSVPALLAIAQGVAATLACGARGAVFIFAGCYVVIRFTQWFSYRRIGGINGDSLGATEQILEPLILAVFTCPSCI